MNDRRALVILGKQGSGKTKKAIEEAKKYGKFEITNIKKLFNHFTLSSVLRNKPDVVIVEDCDPEILNDSKIKMIISEDKLLVEEKCKDPEMVTNVKWIFTININRRFSVIYLTGEEAKNE